MDAGKIVRLVAVVVAVVAGVITIPESAVIIAVLGLVSGYFIEEDRQVNFLIMAVALSVCAAGLDALPGIGSYLTGIFRSLSALANAGACTVIVLRIWAVLKP